MINITDITSGKLNGKFVWICDLRYNNYSDKPIRHIKPIRVLIRGNDKTKKTIYYSESHFIGLNKTGVPVESKIYAPFDNTGFRSRTGIPLNCFDNEDECFKFYKKQLGLAINGLNDYKDSVINLIDKKIDELNKIK